jgi:hypothetical protein
VLTYYIALKSPRQGKSAGKKNNEKDKRESENYSAELGLNKKQVKEKQQKQKHRIPSGHRRQWRSGGRRAGCR